MAAVSEFIVFVYSAEGQTRLARLSDLGRAGV